MQMFFQLNKVDEKTGIVSGRAVEEVLDHAGEIFDYAKSKPHFEAWSSGISKATDGKSAGNIRAMHGKVSAGIIQDIRFNDAEKAIDITALINDPVEKAKLIAGNYTGWSIGGQYVSKWEDTVHKGVMRYEAQPAEISLVDLPCVPTATFTAIKADGSQELRKFHTAESTTTAEVEKSASADEGTSPGEATKTDVEPSADAASVEKRAAFLTKHEPAQAILKAIADAGENPELAPAVSVLNATLDDMFAEHESATAEAGADASVVELAAKVCDLAKTENPSDGMKKVLSEMSVALAPFAPAPDVEKAEQAPLSKVAKAVLDETTHALSKARTEIKTQLEKIDTLQKRVTELEKLPAAKAPVLRVIGKGETTSSAPGAAVIEGEADEIAPVISPNGEVDKFATAIKKTHMQQRLAK